ncbi:MAG TPA: polyamine aminopropyltransferase [Rhodospirillales bacterium]
MPDWFDETDAEDLIIRFATEGIAARERTAFQDLVIFDTPRFGRALALDGIVQLTESDEFYYHEMIAHVPLLAHGRARRVLVIGGGDGGAIREVLRHEVDEVVMVELDPHVVEACREHLPSVNAGAFEDPRLELRFEDGVAYVAQCDRQFDVILVDSTDPVPGPGEVLFGEPFYRDCKRILAPGGILVSQLGVPFLYPEAVRGARRRLARCFADVTFYIVAVPVFAGGYMAFGWASDDRGLRDLPAETLASRLKASGIETRFYTPAFHRASFVLPRPIAELLD